MEKFVSTFVFCTQQTMLSKFDDLIRSLGKNRAVFLEFLLFSGKLLFEMLSALFHLFSIPQMHTFHFLDALCGYQYLLGLS